VEQSVAPALVSAVQAVLRVSSSLALLVLLSLLQEPGPSAESPPRQGADSRSEPMAESPPLLQVQLVSPLSLLQVEPEAAPRLAAPVSAQAPPRAVLPSVLLQAFLRPARSVAELWLLKVSLALLAQRARQVAWLLSLAAAAQTDVPAPAAAASTASSHRRAWKSSRDQASA
jgi:hypothetical protein